MDEDDINSVNLDAAAKIMFSGSKRRMDALELSEFICNGRENIVWRNEIIMDLARNQCESFVSQVIADMDYIKERFACVKSGCPTIKHVVNKLDMCRKYIRLNEMLRAQLNNPAC